MTRRRRWRRHSVALRAARFARRHPTLTAASALSVATGYAAYRWLQATPEASAWTTGMVFALVIAVRLLLGIGPGAIYVFDVLDPRDGYQSVVCGYVGKTTQRPEERYAQHMGTSERYRTSAQPWSDTVVKWRVVNRSRYMTRLGLHVREFWHIRLRRPLYNHTMNLGNSRRIPRWLAVQQREERNAYYYQQKWPRAA